MVLGLALGTYFTSVVVSSLLIEVENKQFKDTLNDYGFKLKNVKSDNVEFLKRNIISLIPGFNILISSALIYFSDKKGHLEQLDRLLKEDKLEAIKGYDLAVDNENNIEKEKINNNHYDYAIERAKNFHCKPKYLKKVKKNK